MSGHRFAIVLLAALAIASSPLPAIAQSRGSRPQGPATQLPPPPRSSQPLPPSAVNAPPFRSMLILRPAPVPAHRPLPIHASWFGLVPFDPYWWVPSSPAPSSDGRPIGGLQLDVEPRRARVYVDGWFVGVVDEFSGYYRHLDLAAGPHRIELEASDYDLLLVDVVVSPGRTATYRASLSRASDRN